MVETAVGIGVLLNLLVYESIGLTAGGMVVPGYLALFMDQPLRIAVTLAAGLATWAVVSVVLGRWVILFGRRRYGAMLVGGLLATYVFELLSSGAGAAAGEWRVIGYIVPGLLANEIDRQGPLATLAVTLVLAIATRILVTLFFRLGL
ncbi:MAG TPA: poly-gamma-glutamate biosynthesis protein PgsC [Gemmatimonadales bacterium]|nr:poly-gamma-glutamate biosynthesis protein PgsC [Gemmatimonadales bacterium]